jgi:recombination protein RecR
MNKINDIINSLTRLPGIGRKSAGRITYFLIKNKEIAKEMLKTIENALNSIIYCSKCGNFTDIDPCSLCSDITRNNSIICVVEEPKDLSSIEDTGMYNGQYHILMGNINPLEGLGPEKLRIEELINRINENKITEVLIATNPTVEGEATFLYLANLLSSYNIKISRIATGIPMGGSLEYSDKITLGKAILSKHYL